MRVREVVVSEFIISARGDFLKVYRLVEEFEGRVSYADVATGFMRVRLHGAPCSEGYVARVLGLVESVSSLLDWCRCEVLYVRNLQQLGVVRKCLAAPEAHSISCITLGDTVRCAKALGGGHVLVEVRRVGNAFKLRAYPVRKTLGAPPTELPVQSYDCRIDSVRDLLSVLCEFSKYLSRCLDEAA